MKKTTGMATVVFFSVSLSFIMLYVFKLAIFKSKPFNCFSCMSFWIAVASSLLIFHLKDNVFITAPPVAYFAAYLIEKNNLI